MLRKALLYGLVIMASIGLGAGVSGAYTWYTYEGHSYALTDPGTWSQAEAAAVAAGGHLTAINNLAEESWLQQTFGYDRFWIGFTDKDQEGTWMWTSGEPVSYTNWAPGEPNNYDSGGEHYAVMNWEYPSNGNTLYGWNDLRDTHYVPGDPRYQTGYQGVIEVVPLPATVWLLVPGLAGLLLWRRRSS